MVCVYVCVFVCICMGVDILVWKTIINSCIFMYGSTFFARSSLLYCVFICWILIFYSCCLFNDL